MNEIHLFQPIQAYYSKTHKLTGTDYHEVCKKAFRYYQEINQATKRKPYARSAYFNKSKIFLELFWHHLFEKKNRGDRIRRLKFLPCAIELIKKSRCPPLTKDNPNKPSELLHRFKGFSAEKNCFFIQIKENKKTGKKWLISIFPADK